MMSYVLFGAVLLLLTAAVLLAAVRSGAGRNAGDSAEARKDTALEALRVLEFEYQSGKVAEAEYASLRRRLELEAVRARDESSPAGSGATLPEAPDPAGEGGPSTDPAGDPAVEARPVTCGQCGRRLTGRESFCPACGTAIQSAG